MRLPNGVFNPYTGIRTNLLFFTKGEPTQEIWYYDHPYPEGYKSYSKTKPIKIAEFAPEKAWWYHREENEFAWKVSVEQIKANNFNLDVKNPRDPQFKEQSLAELLTEYDQINQGIAITQNELKHHLMKSLNLL